MIATGRSKGPRRPNHRRGGAKGQVLGTANAPATRARAAATAAGKAAPTNKIIVSNLPPDVNEAQVKVCFCDIGCIRTKKTHLCSIGTFRCNSRPSEGSDSSLRQQWSLQRCCCCPILSPRRRNKSVPAVQQSTHRRKLVSVPSLPAFKRPVSLDLS